jgi:hypothetical protein
MINNQKIERLLNSLSEPLADLEQIELAYRSAKEEATERLVSRVHELATLADTQATRAQVLRELYWVKRLSTNIIGGAFGLQPGKVRFLAGKFTTEVPCKNSCGNVVRRSYESMHQLRTDETSTTHPKCADCEGREQLARDEDDSSRRAALMRRNEQLRAMSWSQFIRTGEWMYVKSRVVHHADYECQICHRRRIDLYIFLHKNTPQDLPNFATGWEGHEYSVLCEECVPRCSDLLNMEKGELLGEPDFRALNEYYNTH